MLPTTTRVARAVAVASTALALSACAALMPDRSIQSTMTLAPGQSVKGRFEIPGGGRGLVQFQRQPPKKGVQPFPEATTWTGDGKVRIAFPDDPVLPAEGQLGYVSYWLEDGRVCETVVRNATAEPVTFDWIVTGATDAVVNWDLSSPAMMVQ